MKLEKDATCWCLFSRNSERSPVLPVIDYRITVVIIPSLRCVEDSNVNNVQF
jgi:hypothetical protein